MTAAAALTADSQARPGVGSCATRVWSRSSCRRSAAAEASAGFGDGDGLGQGVDVDVCGASAIRARRDDRAHAVLAHVGDVIGGPSGARMSQNGVDALRVGEGEELE